MTAEAFDKTELSSEERDRLLDEMDRIGSKDARAPVVRSLDALVRAWLEVVGFWTYRWNDLRPFPVEEIFALPRRIRSALRRRG
jgi:hypothetical protein